MANQGNEATKRQVRVRQIDWMPFRENAAHGQANSTEVAMHNSDLVLSKDSESVLVIEEKCSFANARDSGSGSHYKSPRATTRVKCKLATLLSTGLRFVANKNLLL